MKENCNSCGREFEAIGQHWRQSTCPYPEMTGKQKEIATGLLMGDGSIENNYGSPRLRIGCKEIDYLKYLSSEFESLSTGVEEYHIPTLTTRATPEFEFLEEWYKSGEKVWPEDVELTPTVLKHWYCGDGNNHSSRGGLRIRADNEKDNTEKIRNMFNRIGVEPTFYTANNGLSIYISVEQSEGLFEYMGDPPAGYEYKWPEEIRTEVSN